MKINFSFILILLAMQISAQENLSLENTCYVIGHRGAPGYGGENTLFGFKKAIDLGADGFEIDLIQTKDGKLIIGHDYELNRLIGEKQLNELYPDRKHGKKWLITDFDLAELRDLKVTYPAPEEERYNYMDLSDDYKMPLLSDVLEYLKEARKEKDRDDLKIYIEIKTKDKYSHTMTKNEIASQIKEDLEAYEMLNDEHVWIQSFDNEMMDIIASDPGFDKLDKCQLGLDSAKEVAKFTSKKRAKKYLKKKILGRNLQMLHIWKVAAKLFIDTRGIPLVELAHEKDIPFHLYTFRDPLFNSDYKAFKTLGLSGFNSVDEELEYFMRLGVDAVMTDYITSALKVRDKVYD